MFVSPITFNNNYMNNQSKANYDGRKSHISNSLSFGSENIYKPTRILIDELVKILNKTGEPLSIQNGRVRFEKAENFKGTNYKISAKLSENGSEIVHSYTIDFAENAQADLTHNISKGSQTISIMPIVPEMTKKYNYSIQKYALELMSGLRGV